LADNNWQPKRYREYLRLLARLRWPARWWAKQDPSDIERSVSVHFLHERNKWTDTDFSALPLGGTFFLSGCRRRRG
jgi:hypothetical protein